MARKKARTQSRMYLNLLMSNKARIYTTNHAETMKIFSKTVDKKMNIAKNRTNMADYEIIKNYVYLSINHLVDLFCFGDGLERLIEEFER